MTFPVVTHHQQHCFLYQADLSEIIGRHHHHHLGSMVEIGAVPVP